MTLRNGREFLSIPGPSTIPDDVLSAMHRPAVDIYSGGLVDTTMSCLDDLRRLFNTTGQTYIYAANGHGAWEAALVNVLSRGDKVLVLASGLFAPLWGEMASMLEIDVEILPSDGHHAVDPVALEQRLRDDPAHEIKAVLVVQVDTASSVVNPVPALRQAIDNTGHSALFMVDTIASLATMPFKMDEWGVDVTVSGSQKGLMTPPGLSFVAAGEKAWAAHQHANLRTYYWDWTERNKPIHYKKYCGTPPEHLLFGLRKALDILFAEGLENVFQRHRILAEAVRRAVAVWGSEGTMAFNVSQPEARANSVTTILANGFEPARLIDFCDRICGVIIGVAIGPLENRAFRIAHMGHVNAPMILGTLGAVEVGLNTLAIPHGKGGLQAAIDWLAESVEMPASGS